MTKPLIDRVRAAFTAGDVIGAEGLLREHLAAAPADTSARVELARLLRARGQFEASLAELDLADSGAPEEQALLLRASLFSRLGRHDEAVDAQRRAIVAEGEHPRAVLGLSHLLRTLGRVGEAADVARRALELSPGLAEAWWALSNIKTVDFSTSDRTAMTTLLADRGLNADGRTYAHFALARAFDSAGEADAAWAHLAEGNRIRADLVGHRPDAIAALVDATIREMTARFFEDRRGWGDHSEGPIFILGMPRSGSSLLEQMLATHSQVEGTSELPDIPALARQISGRSQFVDAGYLQRLVKLDEADIRSLGEAYLVRARSHRRLGRPHFIDKMPNNWLFVGLIRLMLPRARIIDIRRHPMDCGLSNFRELFAGGQTYSYDLGHIGRYYRDYVRLMRHFDAMLPGAVHRVIYEHLVDDPEAQLRATFDYLGLDFEPQVLEFHKTERGVRTASAAQVRQPLNRKGIGHWRRYEQWLEPLAASLGSTLDDWDR